MSNVQLQSWLNNPTDFQMGIQLLDKYCPGKHTGFKKNARKFGENGFYKKKLFALLKDFASNSIEIKKPKRAIVPNKRKYIELNRSMFPADLQSLWDQRLALFKEAAYWHSRVLLLSADQQSAAFTKIINNQTIINEIWNQLDYYHINQAPLPVPKEITQGEYFAALRRLHTLRTYKSKMRYKKDQWNEKFQREFEQINKIVEKAKDKY